VKRLLIIDDDRLVRTSMGLYFESEGWAVDLAANVEQALACMGTPFDAMICDLHLSSRRAGEGIGLVEEARRLAPAAVLVLLSGEGTDQFGAVRPDAMVQKPVRLPQLAKLVTELAARPTADPH
jgi:DNA-binding NtrC family response regulator